MKAATDGPNIGAPGTYVGDFEEAPEFCLQPVPDLAIVAIWGVDPSIDLPSVSATLTFK